MNDKVNRKIVLLITALSSFLPPFMGSSVFIGLPSIGKDFGMDVVTLSWVTLSYLLSAAMFLVPFGKLADIYGRKKIFKYGIIIDLLASILLAYSFNETEFIILRIIQGIGAAMIFGTGMAILTSVYPPEERGKALGITVAAVYLGLSLGPVVSGLLTQYFGWRSIFLSYIPLELIIIILVFLKLHGEWADARGEKLDIIGSMMYGFSLVSMMYGFSTITQSHGMWLILLSLSGLAAFAVWEMKVTNPVLDMHLFMNNKVFRYSTMAALINYSATFTVGFFLSIYLQDVKGLNPGSAGLIMVSQPIIMTVFSPVAGRLSDRIEPGTIASIGMTFTAFGLFLFSFLDEKTSTGYIIVSLIIIGFGFAFFSSPNVNAVMSSVEKKFYGVASATLGTMRLTGQMLSTGIATLILTIYAGNVQITPESYPLFLAGERSAFIVFAVLCFAGIFASLARGKLRPSQKIQGNSTPQQEETATLAGGCFWCLEAIFKELKGVNKVISGYTGGLVPDPSYQEVSSGKTGHVEAVQITFDPGIISFRDLLEVFFTVHDPTTLDRQGADAGTQYRSAVFYHSPAQEKDARETILKLDNEKVWDSPIVTEIVPYQIFYPAEKYHQSYFDHNPDQPYCRVVIEPKVVKFRKKFFDMLKK